MSQLLAYPIERALQSMPWHIPGFSYFLGSLHNCFCFVFRRHIPVCFLPSKSYRFDSDVSLLRYRAEVDATAVARSIFASLICLFLCVPGAHLFPSHPALRERFFFVATLCMYARDLRGGGGGNNNNNNNNNKNRARIGSRRRSRRRGLGRGRGQRSVPV